MVSQNRNRVVGVFCCVVGALTALAIYARPERLHAPAWLAYMACAAFVLAGLVILAMESKHKALYRWAVAALLVAMAVPPNWIAFGPGERRCSAAIGFVRFISGAVACRIAFAIGGVIVAAMAVWAIRMALRGEDAR